MNKKFTYLITLAIILVLLIALCTTSTMHGQISVVMRFGKPVRVITEPGLHFKLPYPVHQVKKIDARLTMFQPKPAEFLTADKKNLILENCVAYRIVDPIQYMRTVRDKDGLELRLSDLLSSHTGLLLGVIELSEIVNTDTSKVKFSQMNSELTGYIQRDAAELGVEVESVFIKRLMLPSQNKLAVYDRMRAERDRIAKKYLAEGEEKALEIRAKADNESRTILAEAKKQASVIKGEADAEAMKIYGEAYKNNIEFYQFIRSLQAYEKMFGDQTTIVLDEKSPLLKTMHSGGKID
jgi:modulator of FtsH protease HflC